MPGVVADRDLRDSGTDAAGRSLSRDVRSGTGRPLCNRGVRPVPLLRSDDQRDNVVPCPASSGGSDDDLDIFAHTPRPQGPTDISREISSPRRSLFPVVAFPRTCAPHNHPIHFALSPDPKRSGWLRVSCRRCGRFIGYRPVTTEGAGLLPSDQSQRTE